MTIKSRNLFLLLFLSQIFFSCSKKNEKIEVDRFLFGTNIKIVVYDRDKKKTLKLIDETYKLMEDISSKYNSKDETSLVNKLNKSPMVPQIIDQEFHGMISKTIQLSEDTSGSFDITIGPLMSLWGFDDLNINELPSEEQIKEVRSLVNYNDIVLTKNSIKLKKEKERIDTGSFLKGFAINKGIEFLKSKGIESAMITAVSSIGTIGNKPDGKPFKIGVQDPKKPENLIYTIDLDNKALGVAGDYQTFVEIEGKKYHHILDAKNGYPSPYNSMVLILCNDSYTADLYDTALFLMKPEEILKYVSKVDGMEVFIIDKSGKQYFSKNIKKYMKELKK